MHTYRKATLAELKSIGFVPADEKYENHITFAKKYYPPEAATMIMVMDSEYNDVTYDNTLKYILVLDKDGNELPPLRPTAGKCRKEWYSLPIPGGRVHGLDESIWSETDDQIDDVVIPLENKIPEFYVKVD